MKKLVLYMLFGILSLPLYAQRVSKTLIQMERLQRTGEYLQALDSATYVLTIEDNTVAKNFVYNNWEQTMRLTNDRLSRLLDDNDLEQARERLTIYRQLDDIYTNLRIIGLPLYGPNNKWVWQPDMAYYSGQYDSERMHTYALVMQKADEALRSYDVEQAKAYYEYALQYLFVDEKERNSNAQRLLHDVNQRIEVLAQSTQIHEVILAYNLVDLSLWLDATQADKTAQRTHIQQRVSALYLEAAAQYQAQGDTIAAYEATLSAEDWK